jgi:tetratricopeptide (TPR) repeat protein
MTVFGVILVGLSIWTRVTVGVSADGTIEAKFEQRLNEVEENVQEVEHNVQTFQKDVVDSVSKLKDVPDEQVASLKRRENVGTLIRQGKYDEALQIDPQNTIALMRSLENSAKTGKFEDAVDYFSRLRSSNESGVGYAEYPQAILALDRTGNAQKALQVLEELDSAIAEDVSNGYGYLSRSNQLERLANDLQMVSDRADSGKVNSALRDLVKELEAIIAQLRTSKDA